MKNKTFTLSWKQSLYFRFLSFSGEERSRGGGGAAAHSGEKGDPKLKEIIS
jgi:hypothetical protein